MRILRFILLFFFTLIGLFSQLEAKVILTENEKIESFLEQDFKETSAEKEWLNLLHLQKKSTNQNQTSPFQFSSGSLNQNSSEELCLKSKFENLKSSFQVGGESKSHPEIKGCDEVVFHEGIQS